MNLEISSMETTTKSTMQTKQQKKKKKREKNCLVIGGCKQSNKYFHDYLHCKSCRVDPDLRCWLKGCLCRGNAYLLPVVNHRALFAHQVPNHQLSTKIYINRPERARRSVIKAFNRQSEMMESVSLASESSEDSLIIEYVEKGTNEICTKTKKKNSSVMDQEKCSDSNLIPIISIPGDSSDSNDIDPQLLIQILSEIDDNDLIDINGEYDQNDFGLSSKKRPRDECQ